MGRMKLLPFLYHLFECISINSVYVSDPKKAINENWESIHFIVHDNQNWRETMESDRVRLRFVESMLSIPNSVIVTPPSAVRIIDETPYCWHILAYNSDTDHNLKVLTRLPEHHHKTFSFSDLHHERHHIGTQPLSKWGLLVPIDTEMDYFLKIYEKMSDSLKVVAVFMDHYKNPSKFYVRNKIDKLIKSLHDQAVIDARMEGLEPSHKLDFKTTEEWEANQQIFNDYLNEKITSGLNHIDLKRWLTARIIEDEMETQHRRSNDEIRLEPRTLENEPKVVTHEFKIAKEL